MTLVNLSKIQKDAQLKKYGICAPEIWDQFSTKAFIEAASETRSPVILIIGVPILLKLGIKSVAQMVKSYADETDIPIVLHLDECQDAKIIFKSISAGFTSVMFDGAELGLNLEENIKQTKNIVQFAHYMGITVEASLGRMPLSADGTVNSLKLPMVKTKPEEAKRFCQETGVDAFAPSIGNYHECYKEAWPNPDFDLAKKIYDMTDNVPMVAHGCTGMSKEQLGKAVNSGFVKFNTGTLYQVFFRSKIKDHVDEFEGYPASFSILYAAMGDLKNYLKDQIVKNFKSANRY